MHPESQVLVRHDAKTVRLEGDGEAVGQYLKRCPVLWEWIVLCPVLLFNFGIVKSVIDLDFQREFPSKDVKILIFKMSLINSDINKKGESK